MRHLCSSEKTLARLVESPRQRLPVGGISGEAEWPTDCQHGESVAGSEHRWTPKLKQLTVPFTESSPLETGLKAHAMASTYSELLINPKQMIMTMNFKQVLNFSFQFEQKVNQQAKNGGIPVCIPQFLIELLHLCRRG